MKAFHKRRFWFLVLNRCLLLLRHVEAYLKDICMAGLAFAWAVARRRPPEGYGHDGPGVRLGDCQTEIYLEGMGMTGLASAWAMARRRPI